MELKTKYISNRIVKNIILLSIVFFAQIFATATAQDCQEQNTYTPEKGTQERKDILDALRENVYKMHNTEVVFVVRYLKVYDGWAWVHTLPQTPDGSNMFEDLLALLHQENDQWKVIEIPCAEEDNPLCITSEDYYQNLIKRHPGLPECILPTNNY